MERETFEREGFWLPHGCDSVPEAPQHRLWPRANNNNEAATAVQPAGSADSDLWQAGHITRC